jgi:hypothetical protein
MSNFKSNGNLRCTGRLLLLLSTLENKCSESDSCFTIYSDLNQDLDLLLLICSHKTLFFIQNIDKAFSEFSLFIVSFKLSFMIFLNAGLYSKEFGPKFISMNRNYCEDS